MSSRELAEIKATAGKWQLQALQSRKKLLRALSVSDRHVAKIYNNALRRALRDYQANRGVESLLEAIDTDFKDSILFRDLSLEIENAINTGAAAGITFSKDVSLDVLRAAGLEVAPMVRAMNFQRQRAVAACHARIYRDGLTISDRIWRISEEARDSMKAIVQVGIGEDAVKVARALETYVNQGAAVTAAKFPNMMSRMGSRIPANIDYNALRLARTELTAAYSQGTIAAAKASPAIKNVKWVLSNTHPRTDICDQYAHGGKNGDGVYAAGDCPISPAHPNCLCTIQPAPEDMDSLVKRLKEWRQDPSSQKDIEKWYKTHYKPYEDGGKPVITPVIQRTEKKVITPPKKEEKTLGNLRERYKILPTMTAAERETAIKAAGKELLTDVTKNPVWEQRRKALQKAEKAFAEAREAYHKIPIIESRWDDLNAAGEALDAARKKLQTLQSKTLEENALTLSTHLGKVRTVGVDEADLKSHFKGNSKMRPVVEKAYRFYPQDWTDKSFARGKLSVRKVGRGYYNDYDGIIAISGNGNGRSLKTAIHEIGHRIEYTIPDILQAEKAFYERRTEGEDLEWLGSGYGKSEKARRDNFLSMYMGKDYGGRAYELVSMGFELAYTDPLELAKDKDMAEWIFGLLALI